MVFTLKKIAELVNGEVLGDENQEVSQFCKIEEGKSGGISFLANPKYEPMLYQTNATAVIVNAEFQPTKKINTTLIKVENAYTAFTTLLTVYQSISNKRKVEIAEFSKIKEGVIYGKNLSLGEFSVIEENCIIGDNVTIYPNCFIGKNVKIGNETTIYAGVKIYADCEIHENVTIHAGAVIGSDGFGFAPQPDGTYKTIPQLGNVVIENNVSIGANATIDRATMGSTVIKNGAKIDNLVQIAHNVVVGENTVIASQTGVSGSTKIGRNCTIAGQVGIAGHIEIADFTKIGGQAGVTNTVKEKNSLLSGTPAFNLKDYLKSNAYFRKLPILEKRISELEKK